MIEHTETYDFGGFKYEETSWCLGSDAYYIRPDGTREQLPVHGAFMTAWQAIKIHAMNMNGYCP